MSNDSYPSSSGSDEIAAQASLWLARRDRGLSPDEQDEYLQWLAADPRHSQELARHGAAFQRMMRLYEWQPGQSGEPNPDLFSAQQKAWPRAWRLGLAAAAILAVATTFFWTRPAATPGTPTASYLWLNESKVLPDGSIVELKEGSSVELTFTETARRVRLRGEAHFTVAKKPTPFVVEAANVRVRALGTAFNIRLDQDEVDVLVTEGLVQLEQVVTPPDATARSAAPAVEPAAVTPPAAETPTELPTLGAGQRATVLRSGRRELQVSNVSPAEIDQTLGWQVPRLRFSETPLAVAINEFNQRNRTRLVLVDETLGTLPIDGTFRVDNVDGFVRLLEVTLDIRAEARAGGKIILSRRQ